MVSRRSLLAATVPALTAATAGCSALLGSRTTFSATTATVSADARSGTGYEEVAVEDLVVERTFSAADQERTVEVVNRVARYERRVDLPALPAQRAAAFVVLASPKIELFGRAFNPVGDASNRELLEMLQDRYTGLEVGDRVGGRTVTMLGQETTAEKYEGSASLAGAPVDVFVHVARVEHGGDFVIAIAVYPRLLDGEDDTVAGLIEGIRHDD